MTQTTDGTQFVIHKMQIIEVRIHYGSSIHPNNYSFGHTYPVLFDKIRYVRLKL